MKKIAKMTGLMLLAVSMLQLSNVSAASANTLKPGQTLAHDAMITSADGRFALKMQWDGDLVHYQAGTALWRSGTKGAKYQWYDSFLGRYYTRYAEVLRLTSSGQLQITDPGYTVVFWQADTKTWMDNHYRVPMIYPTGLVGDTLNIQNDGNVVLYDTIGNSNGDWLPVWATNTGGR